MKNEKTCSFDDQRPDVLMSYLYDEITADARQAFEAHLPECATCRSELKAMREVRADLAAWASPEPAVGVGGKTPRASLRLAPAPAAPWTAATRGAPRWLQAAAAVLLVAGGLGLANLRVSYSSDGFVLRTGWMAPDARDSRTTGGEPSRQLEAAQNIESAAPWRTDLAALERLLRDELAAQRQASTTPAAEGDALVRRVRALIAESERRQQRELALRVAEVARETQVQRQADLVRIERSLGLIQSRTGVEVMRTQQQLNNLAQRVSQRP